MPEYVRVGGLKPLGVPFSRSTIIAMSRAGTFPKPVAYGAHRAWLRTDIETWVARFRAARSV
jgi:predicted DNA-binding transcriptional regulator AlpA